MREGARNGGREGGREGEICFTQQNHAAANSFIFVSERIKGVSLRI